MIQVCGGDLYVYSRLLRFLFLGSLGFGLELAVDTDVGVLVETGIGFEAWFGLGTAFVNRVVMVEETEPPFEGIDGMVMLQGVGSALGFFDEVTVSHTGR